MTQSKVKEKLQLGYFDINRPTNFLGFKFFLIKLDKAAILDSNLEDSEISSSSGSDSEV